MNPIDWAKIGDIYSVVRKRFPKRDFVSLTLGPFTMIVPIRKSVLSITSVTSMLVKDVGDEMFEVTNTTMPPTLS